MSRFTPERPRRLTAYSPRRAALLAGAALVTLAAACGDGRDPAARARAAERREIREAARQAARLATGGDTGRGAGMRDTGAHFNVDVHDAVGLTRAGDPPLGPGDVRVASTDGALVLSLVGDTVRMRLGDSVLAKVRSGTESRADTGFGGLVANTVKAAVGGAMGEVMRLAVRVPVREVTDLRYEDGRLLFGTPRHRGGREGTSSGARFARADAERFIAAVRARQGALGAGG